MKQCVNFVKPGAVLLAVAVAVALILGAVSAVTAGAIEAHALDAQTEAMQAVLPAASYTKFDPAAYGAATEDIQSAYYSQGTGWVIEVSETGSQGVITMMVGVSASHTCTGVSITESSETAGLGAVAAQASDKGDAFRAQFVGLSGTAAVTKEGGSVDAISGATITSKAVCKGVTSALAYCATLG